MTELGEVSCLGSTLQLPELLTEAHFLLEVACMPRIWMLNTCIQVWLEHMNECIQNK